MVRGDQRRAPAQRRGGGAARLAAAPARPTPRLGRMTYLFPELHQQRRPSRDQRDWLDVYRQLAADAERAAVGVRYYCAEYVANRTPATQLAYAVADRHYDQARGAFQRQSRDIVTGVRCIAGIARAMQLAEAHEGSRML